jgi:hypothetical protein
MRKLTDTSSQSVSKVTHRTSPNATKVKRTVHHGNMHPSAKGLRGGQQLTPKK